MYKLDEVLEGELDTVIEPLLREHQTNELQRFSDETDLKEDRITIATWKQANFKTDRLELDLLLSRVTGRSRAEIIACPQMTLSNNQLKRLNDDLRILEAGTPFAYIVGKKEFFGIELEISESVLVPLDQRPSFS